MLSFLDASGTRAFIISLATESTLRAAARFAFGDPRVKRVIVELPERWLIGEVLLHLHNTYT